MNTERVGTSRRPPGWGDVASAATVARRAHSPCARRAVVRKRSEVVFVPRLWGREPRPSGKLHHLTRASPRRMMTRDPALTYFRTVIPVGLAGDLAPGRCVL